MSFSRTTVQQRLCTFLTPTSASTSCCQWRCSTGEGRTSESSTASASRSSPNLPRKSSLWKMLIVSVAFLSKCLLNCCCFSLVPFFSHSVCSPPPPPPPPQSRTHTHTLSLSHCRSFLNSLILILFCGLVLDLHEKSSQYVGMNMFVCLVNFTLYLFCFFWKSHFHTCW